MTRYSPSRQYLSAGVIAVFLAVLSGWVATDWTPAAIPAALLLLSAGIVLALAFQPVIEVNERSLIVGRRTIPWPEIRRVDRTGWMSPLVVHLTLTDRSRVLLIYPGELDSANRLLRQIRRCAREALIDGIPYRQFWGEALQAGVEPSLLPPPRYPLLRAEDEAEVERLYQRLKTVGHIDPKNSSDEK